MAKNTEKKAKAPKAPKAEKAPKKSVAKAEEPALVDHNGAILDGIVVQKERFPVSDELDSIEPEVKQAEQSEATDQPEEKVYVLNRQTTRRTWMSKSEFEEASKTNKFLKIIPAR